MPSIQVFCAGGFDVVERVLRHSYPHWSETDPDELTVRDISDLAQPGLPPGAQVGYLHIGEDGFVSEEDAERAAEEVAATLQYFLQDEPRFGGVRTGFAMLVL